MWEGGPGWDLQKVVFPRQIRMSELQKNQYCRRVCIASGPFWKKGPESVGAVYFFLEFTHRKLKLSSVELCQVNELATGLCPEGL